MVPIRALHIADIHVGVGTYGHLDPNTGVNGRVVDYLHRFDDAIDYALAHEVDVFLFAGDAFKTADPSPTYQREFARRIKRLSDEGMPTVLLTGNHDLPLAERRASAIEIFATLQVPYITVADDYKLYPVQTRRGAMLHVAAIPYPLRNRLVAVDQARGVSLEELDRLVSDAIVTLITDMRNAVLKTPTVPAILMGHFSVQDAQLGSERSIMLGRDIIIPKILLRDEAWDYVALGHIHKHQDLNPGRTPSIVYSGSIERIDFGEEKEAKGWVVADIAKGQTTWQFVTHHQHPARPFVTIYADAQKVSDPTDAVLAKIEPGAIKDAVVRVVVEMRAEQEPLLRERDIRAALAGAYYLTAIERRVERPERHRLGDVNVEEQTPIQLLEHYFTATQVPPERAKQLLDVARTLMTDDET